MRTSIRHVLVVASTSTLLASVTAVAPATSAVAADEPPRPPFYEAPAQLPAENGDLIRYERLTFTLDPADVTSTYQRSFRVLYRSTDRNGAPIAVSGVVLVPKTAWTGPGERPVIGFAAGTQGLADRCAPSRQFSEGIEYEGMVADGLLRQGYAVAMTDYQGLGTEGVHTYMDRQAQAHAVLDMVRAAQEIPEADLSTRAPVGLQGYSQGGAGAAAAAELAPTYAPELDVTGAAVGAVPADLDAVAKNLDGSMYAEFLLFATRGLAASYDIDLDRVTNDLGDRVMDDVEGHCVTDLFSNSFRQSRTLTESGQSLVEIMQTDPWKSIVNEQRIGRTAPQVPVLIGHSKFDDTIPYRVGAQLFQDWCSRGANVRMATSYAPTHLGGMPPFSVAAQRFWVERFAGQTQTSQC